MNKEWHLIEGTDFYVSIRGEVKGAHGKIRRTWLTEKGYVKLHIDGKAYKMHRLVGKYFIPNEFNKPEINHKDFNKQNNHVSNLEWCTRQENMDHAYLNNRVPLPSVKSGLSNHISKPVVHTEYGLFTNVKEASKICGVTDVMMAYMLSGKRKNWSKFQFAI